MAFTERECDAMDAHCERIKDEEHETRCRLNIKAPSGVLIGCYLDAGHAGPCMTRSGIRGEVTADTITDEQIRELRDARIISDAFYEFATAPCWYQRDYRTRCAEILNARAKENK
jgi:hypothetical protein